jgi:hypothetical protein
MADARDVLAIWSYAWLGIGVYLLGRRRVEQAVFVVVSFLVSAAGAGMPALKR